MARRSKSQSFDEDDGVLDRQPRGTFHYAEDVIRKFDGRDKAYPATKWAQDIDDTGDIFEWTQTQRLLVARRSLTGTAALWFNSEKVFKCWETLKQAICKEFPDAIDAKAIHEIMSARKKKPSESCIDYMFAMKELGRRGKMADYVAIKYIIDGIRDLEINKVMLYGVTTYPELKEKFKIYEMIKEKSRCHEKDSNIRQEEKEFPYRCYNCGEKSHKNEDCPQKNQGKKCFRCNGFGHISSNCPEKSKTTPLSSTATALSGSSAASEAIDPVCEVGGPAFAMVGMIGSERNMADEICHGGDVDVLDVNKPESFTKPVKSVKIMCGKVNALIDSGSDVNLMSLDCYEELGSRSICDSRLTLTGLGPSKVVPIGQFKTNIEIDGHTYSDVIFHIIPIDIIPFKLLIGHQFLQNVITVMKGGSVWMKPDDWLRDVDCGAYSVDVVGNMMDQDVREQVVKLIDACQPHPTKESPIELKIMQKDDIPVPQRPQRVAPIVEKQRKEWLNQGMIGEELRKEAKIQILKTLDENKRNYNKKRKKGTVYTDCEHVAAKRTQFEPGVKLKPKLFGPYQKYGVEKADSQAAGPHRTSTSADRLRPWPDIRVAPSMKYMSSMKG